MAYFLLYLLKVSTIFLALFYHHHIMANEGSEGMVKANNRRVATAKRAAALTHGEKFTSGTKG